MFRFGLVLLAFSGCVSFPYAHLVSAEAQLEAVQAPVVCGPLGFRKVPLQARWGEYVRVTVAAPGALAGTALVHAGGVALEPFAWSTQTTGALVVEARFPNEDPDRRFVLERERPIDVTLTGLEGSCEGAVFTIEHGVLVPTIDERAWLAELERRGGPALVARREAARVEADARRQAHYAAWDARQQVEVSVEVVAQAELVRQAHYAQWGAQRHQSQSPLPLGGEGQGEGVIASAEVTNTSAVGGGVAVEAVSNTTPSGLGGGVAVGSVSTPAPSCDGSPCAGSSSGAGSVVHASTTTGATSQAAPSCVGVGTQTATSVRGTASTVAVTTPAEWTQPSDVSLRAPADVRAGAALSVNTWAQPSDAQLRAGAVVSVEERWSQPYQPRLEPVAITTETHVVGTAVEPQEVVGEPEPAAVLVPAMFQLMFNVAAAAGSVQQQQVHGARPAR